MDDDELMSMLGEALAADQEPSPRVMQAAKAAFDWLRIDDELAELVFDSADIPAVAGVRGARTPRQLTYRAEDLLIDCEVHPRVLLGQIVPATFVTLELCSPDGRWQPVEVDDQGRFAAEPTPAGPISLRCLRVGRRDMVTPWLLA